MRHLESLPDEILIYILQYLPLRDRMNMRSLNKLWRSLNTIRSVVKDDILKVSKFEDIDSYMYPGFFFVNVEIDLYDMSEKRPLQTPKFLQVHGKGITGLKFNFNDEAINDILLMLPETCPNVELLKLNGNVGLINIEHGLKFSNLEFLELNIGLELERLELFDSCVQFKELAVNFIDANDWEDNNTPPPPALIDLITRNCTKLQSFFQVSEKDKRTGLLPVEPFLKCALKIKSFGARLNIQTPLDDELLYTISRIKNLRMLSIWHTQCPQSECYFTEYSLISFLHSRRLLTQLELCNFRNYWALTKNALAALSNMKYLNTLNLSWNEMTSEDLGGLFNSTVMPNLYKLSLAAADVGDSFTSIAPLIPNIEYLDLYDTRLKAASFQAILTHNKELLHLRIDAVVVNDTFAQDISAGLPNLKVLELCFRDQPHDRIAEIGSNVLQLIKFKQLRYIYLVYCGHLLEHPVSKIFTIELSSPPPPDQILSHLSTIMVSYPTDFRTFVILLPLIILVNIYFITYFCWNNGGIAEVATICFFIAVTFLVRVGYIVESWLLMGYHCYLHYFVLVSDYFIWICGLDDE